MGATYYVDGALGSDSNAGTSAGAGNAWATLQHAASTATGAGITINVKASATYTISSTLTFNSGTTVPNIAPFIVRGYTSSPGDGGRATIQVTSSITGSSFALSDGGNSHVIFDSLKVDGNGICTNGIFANGRGSSLFNCEVTNCTVSGIQATGNTNYAVGCDVHGMASGASYCYILTGGYYHYCVARSSPCPGFSMNANNGGGEAIECIAYGLTGVNGIGFYLTNCLIGSMVRNCIAYGNSSDGIQLGSGSYAGVLLLNNVLVNNGGYGLNMPSWQASSAADYNFFYGNTSGPRNGIAAGPHDVTLTGDPFAAGSSGNFALNSTSGAGASVRAAAYPSLFPHGSTSNYRDGGASQHQDSGGGSSGMLVIPGLNGGFA